MLQRELNRWLVGFETPETDGFYNATEF